MVELRYLRHPRTLTEPDRLQYREVTPAHGEGLRWVKKHCTKWQDVPVVIGELPKEQ